MRDSHRSDARSIRVARGGSRLAIRRRKPFRSTADATISAATQPALERLERAWLARLQPFPELSPLVTGRSLRAEPRHRWLSYRQGFAPELVRLFLAETEPRRRRLPMTAVLDPFCGVGTVPLECSLRGVEAVGIEALPWLAFAAEQKLALSVPRFPDLTGCSSAIEAARRLVEPVHRAALLFAIARRHSAAGDPLAAALDLGAQLRDVLPEMRADLAVRPTATVRIEAGDSRRLVHVPDASIAAVLTSPPYYSRHDYLRSTRPLAEVFEVWFGAAAVGRAESGQVRAHRRFGRRGDATAETPGTVAEACRLLQDRGAGRVAGVVRAYFDDLRRSLAEVARVLAPGGVGWLVVGGARVRGVVLASDLVLAELAETLGLVVEEVRVTREVGHEGRATGRLTGVMPRESIVVLHKPGTPVAGETGTA